MSKPLIPFYLYPFSWGMKGKSREIAQAEYELTGKHLELRLLEIEKDNLTDIEFRTKELRLHLKYNDINKRQYNYSIAELIEDEELRLTTLAKISSEGHTLDVALLDIENKFKNLPENEYTQRLLKLQFKNGLLKESDYFRALVDLMDDPIKKAQAILELDFKEGKITENKYNKERATLNNEPWVNVLNMSFDINQPDQGEFELDWNDHFVKSLEDAGYSGLTSDEVVNLWLMTVCKNIAMEEFGGVGTFDEDVEANLEAQPASHNGRITYK